MKKIFLLILLPFFILGCGDDLNKSGNNIDQNNKLSESVDEKFLDEELDNANEKTIGLSFPPVKNKEELDFTLLKLKDLGVDRIRFATKWEYRDLGGGEFNWEPLDQRIDFFKENNIHVLLTVDFDDLNYGVEEDFKKFIRELSKRYSNKIDKIQFGNEWDTDESVNIEKFVKYNNIFYEEIKNNSPETDFVLGGVTRYTSFYKELCKNSSTDLDFSKLKLVDNKTDVDLVNYLKNDLCKRNKEKSEKVYKNVDYVLENAEYDLIDFHLYDDAENWHLHLDNLQKRVNKPVVVSEFGGPSPNYEIYSDKYQAERIEEYLKVIKSLSVEEAYYFKLVDDDYSFHKKSGLIYEKGEKHKFSYDVFKRMLNY